MYVLAGLLRNNSFNLYKVGIVKDHKGNYNNKAPHNLYRGYRFLEDNKRNSKIDDWVEVHQYTDGGRVDPVQRKQIQKQRQHRNENTDHQNDEIEFCIHRNSLNKVHVRQIQNQKRK